MLTARKHHVNIKNVLLQQNYILHYNSTLSGRYKDYFSLFAMLGMLKLKIRVRNASCVSAGARQSSAVRGRPPAVRAHTRWAALTIN